MAACFRSGGRFPVEPRMLGRVAKDFHLATGVVERGTSLNRG